MGKNTAAVRGRAFQLQAPMMPPTNSPIRAAPGAIRPVLSWRRT